ncbi:hypothetical protein BWQ96_05977 [Gracilariopsis chorda]|uniref:Uncharacterized protein n=1 Tax=Gracilariopsis chorda TaxID=448386 RepID=A0A2V3IQC5_9FLOR|nr:hypothetical protein BWQ96_05977 [Gracilariopsis chorda]|eukprot:PXF44273.1 hypothetical protein BWQ96_05977 [Gracilariopsis chorda]
MKVLRDRDCAIRLKQDEDLREAEQRYMLLSQQFLNDKITNSTLAEIIRWHFKRLETEHDLNKDTFHWALEVIRSLFHVRSVIGDEGMGVFAARNFSDQKLHLKSVRNAPSSAEVQAREGEVFPTLNNLVSRRLEGSFYATSNAIRGKVTRKTQVRKAGLIIYESGLVYKLPKSTLQKRRRTGDTSENYLHIERYRGVLTTDIYHNHNRKEQSSDTACRMHVHWRLCPTEVLLSVFNTFILDLLAKDSRKI